MNSSAWRLLAGSRWRQSMMAYSGCFARMCWAENQGGGMCSAISLEETAPVAWRWRQKEWALGAASPWRNSAKSSCARTNGTLSHAPRGKLVSMKSISTPTLSQKEIRSRGSEAVASAIGALIRCVASRWSGDYVARPVRGDPRGRKFGVGPRAANLRRPARAEGEKRFRSATRNP
jgi:hypothetical protein